MNRNSLKHDVLRPLLTLEFRFTCWLLVSTRVNSFNPFDDLLAVLTSRSAPSLKDLLTVSIADCEPVVESQGSETV